MFVCVIRKRGRGGCESFPPVSCQVSPGTRVLVGVGDVLGVSIGVGGAVT